MSPLNSPTLPSIAAPQTWRCCAHPSITTAIFAWPACSLPTGAVAPPWARPAPACRRRHTGLPDFHLSSTAPCSIPNAKPWSMRDNGNHQPVERCRQQLSHELLRTCNDCFYLEFPKHPTQSGLFFSPWQQAHSREEAHRWLLSFDPQHQVEQTLWAGEALNHTPAHRYTAMASGRPGRWGAAGCPLEPETTGAPQRIAAKTGSAGVHPLLSAHSGQQKPKGGGIPRPLLRWQRGGIWSPNTFIAYAEEQGLICR